MQIAEILNWYFIIFAIMVDSCLMLPICPMQVISIACCVFYSHCGNRAVLQEKSSERRNIQEQFPFWNKEDGNLWISNILHLHEFKDQVCSSWFAPVGSARDYPLLSKWVIYREVLYCLYKSNFVLF